MDNIRIELLSSVDATEWDAIAKKLGGSFFHCHAHALYESENAHSQPLFVNAFNSDGEQIGIAVGHIASPRNWPFSKFCRIASFSALPATTDNHVESAQKLLFALELRLRAAGVFRIHVASFDSINSASILSVANYRLSERAEFYLDVSRPLEEISAGLKGARRTDIRKAEKSGLTSRLKHEFEGQAILIGLQAASMERRNLDFSLQDRESTEKLRAQLVEKERALLLVSEYDGDPVNAAMFGLFGKKAYYLLSGSSAAGNTFAGPVHILWTAIGLLKQRGVTELNLGGVSLPAEKGDPSYGLYRFKRDFGAEAIEQPAGVKVISKTGSMLYRLMTTLKRLIH